MIFRALLIIGLMNCVSLSSQAEEKIKMWVATSVKAGIFNVIKPHFEKKTGIVLDYPQDTTKGDSNDYFIDLINNKVEASTTSLSYDDWKKNVEKKGVKVPSDITHRVIGADLMNVYVNPKIGISKLSLEQIADISSGKVTNWKHVGGPDQEIVLVRCMNKTATMSGFRKFVLKSKNFGGKFIDTPTSFDDQLAIISSTPGAWGFMPGTVWSNLATEIDTPPIGRPITLITKGRPSKKLQTLLDFIANDAKNYGVGSKPGQK